MNNNLPKSIQKLIFEIDNAGKMNKSMISEIVNLTMLTELSN